MALDVFSGLALAVAFVLYSLASAEPGMQKNLVDKSRGKLQLLDSTLARLMQIKLQSKFQRERPGDAASGVPSSLENPLQKRASYGGNGYYKSTGGMVAEGQPSRMSYDPEDFAYRMSIWPESGAYPRGVERQATAQSSEDNLEYWPNPEKRRWRSRCDFSRITHKQFVQFLKTGILCGRRGHRIRFGFAGKR